MSFEKPDFDLVMARLKEALGAASYAEIGRRIGLSTSAYANRKRAGSIPYEEIIAIAHSEKISLEWLIFGEGVAREGAPKTSVTQINNDLIARCLVEIRRAMALPEELTKESITETAQLGSLAAVLYNKVANIENEKHRIAELKFEATELASVAKIMSGRNLL